ncbi:MAG: tetratricopeptide repeat protein, partial [Planctomycetes bacterium]|nr:tetratricopeptide repeat protein [Planctomycetota bacterium]
SPPPLSVQEIDNLLLRAEQNLILHGLSLDDRFLDRARADYRVAAERMPEEAGDDRRATASFHLAFCLARGEFPEAPRDRQARAGEVLLLLDRVAHRDGSFPGLWIVDGLVREQMADLKRAVENLTKGLEGLEKVEGLAPWQAYQLRLFGLLARSRALMDPTVGREHLALKDVDAALALGTEAMQDPRTPRDNRLRRIVLTHRAAALQRLDHLDDAERILRTLIREDPGVFVHPYNLALVLAQQFRFPEALELYRKAAELSPGDPRPHLKIAFILLKFPAQGAQPDPDAAEREAAKVLSLTGEETDEYLALRGEASLARGDLKEAERWFRRALAKNPECRASLNGLVRILGQEDERSPERQDEFEEFRRRLTELTRSRNQGKGMDNEKPTLTFC